MVVSGDTATRPGLARFATGADVVAHEALRLPGVIAIVKRATNAPRQREHK